MKKIIKTILGFTIIGIIFIIFLSLLNIKKTDIQTFEFKCKETGGNFISQENNSYCECHAGHDYDAYAVFYNDVKNEIWKGC